MSDKPPGYDIKPPFTVAYFHNTSHGMQPIPKRRIVPGITATPEQETQIRALRETDPLAAAQIILDILKEAFGE